GEGREGGTLGDPANESVLRNGEALRRGARCRASQASGAIPYRSGRRSVKEFTLIYAAVLAMQGYNA
ncbi:MAG TPA: hypothetical protein VGG44_11065, partial [Tepidisphaeraceae bacterium]